MNERVLVAYDGSEPSARAVDYAADHFHEGEVVLVTVVDPYDRLHGAYGGMDLSSVGAEDAYEQAKADLEEMQATFDDGTSVTTAVGVGRPAHTILDLAAEHEVDHILIGSHGRSGAQRVLLGSVAETVLRRAAVPVTIIR